MLEDIPVGHFVFAGSYDIPSPLCDLLLAEGFAIPLDLPPRPNGRAEKPESRSKNAVLAVKDFPVKVPKPASSRKVEAVVERSLEDIGLVRAMKDTLRKYPGSVHWHYKKPAVSGTVELTYWPAEARLWITVQDGRRAEWIDRVLPSLRRDLQRRLR